VEDYGINIKPRITGISNPQMLNANKPDLIVYPNPSQGIFNIKINLLQGSEFKLDVVNSLGQAVIHKSLNTQAGSLNEQLDLSSLADGLYYLFAITPEGGIAQTRLIKQ
ncbi:MAG: T9SS type A sorting domain-containing protein, partial [Bacteroidetes bacterium]|nr:T9SS type A sorting domain-containing protein [Bacteroidota bacterium]